MARHALLPARSPGAATAPPSPVPRPLPAFDAPQGPVFSRYPDARWWWRARRIPWTLYRYVLLEVLRASVLAVLAVSVVYAAVVAYQTVRSGMQLAFIWPFLVGTCAYPLFCSLPLSVLFGVTLTVGRMVSDLEIAAARTHGGSHLQLYAPVVALGLACASLGHYLNGWVVPELHYEKRNLQQYILRQLENLGSGSNRTILLPEGGGSLFVGAYEGPHLRRVHIDLKRELQSSFVPDIQDTLPEKLPESVTLLALEGTLEITPDRRGLNLHLRGVDILIPERISGTRSGHDTFIQKFSISKNISIPLSFEERRRSVKDRENDDLAVYIDELRNRVEIAPEDRDAAENLQAARGEWHRRLAFSLSGLTFPLIGATLCFLLDLRSRLVPFFVANLVVLVVFYPLLMVGSQAVHSGGLPPALAMALPNLALLALGGVLTRKVLAR